MCEQGPQMLFMTFSKYLHMISSSSLFTWLFFLVSERNFIVSFLHLVSFSSMYIYSFSQHLLSSCYVQCIQYVSGVLTESCKEGWTGFVASERDSYLVDSLTSKSLLRSSLLSASSMRLPVPTAPYPSIPDPLSLLYSPFHGNDHLLSLCMLWFLFSVFPCQCINAMTEVCLVCFIFCHPCTYNNGWMSEWMNVWWLITTNQTLKLSARGEIMLFIALWFSSCLSLPVLDRGDIMN